MTQEDKLLLLKDLCARLPYGVKMNHIADDKHQPDILIGIAKDMITLRGPGGYECVPVEHYKPYLFPMSSMTEEQREEFVDIEIRENLKYIDEPYKDEIRFRSESLQQDYLNKNHFDYRGLIEKGLAIDATGLNIY